MESPTNFPPDSWVHTVGVPLSLGLLVTIFAPTPVATPGERRIEMEADELSNVSP